MSTLTHLLFSAILTRPTRGLEEGPWSRFYPPEMLLLHKPVRPKRRRREFYYDHLCSVETLPIYLRCNAPTVFRSVFFLPFSNDVPTPTKASTFVNTFKRQDSHKMVRFVPFVMALVALGVTAGARVPSTKKGESTLLSLPRKRREELACVVGVVLVTGAQTINSLWFYRWFL